MLRMYLTTLAFIFVFSLTTASAQTRGAVALTVKADSNLGNAEGNLGGLGTIETRQGRFGFTATGTVGQLRKNAGGSGIEGAGEAQARYFIKDFFIAGGLSASHYSVKQFSKSALAVTVGVGVSKTDFTLSANYDHDVSGVTRRNIFRVRPHYYSPKRFLIGKPYVEAQVAIVQFNQHGSQTGVGLRFGIGFWFGDVR